MKAVILIAATLLALGAPARGGALPARTTGGPPAPRRAGGGEKAIWDTDRPAGKFPGGRDGSGPVSRGAHDLPLDPPPRLRATMAHVQPAEPGIRPRDHARGRRGYRRERQAG